MKKFRSLLILPLLGSVLLFSAFSPVHKKSAAILNYAWYTPSGEFVAWSTLVNAEVVSDANTNPTGGTLVLEGYTSGGEGLPPGTLVYELYTHP